MLYGKYQFSCQLETDSILPYYKGSTFRGVFGHALKGVVCALKRQECPECPLSQKCIYPLVFETAQVLKLPEKIKISAPPHPFVIEPPLTTETDFPKRADFDFNLLLFGEVNNSLPYFVYAMDRMGRIGIGKRIKGQRGQFKLKSVKNGQQTIYKNTDKELKRADALEHLSISETNGSPDNLTHLELTLKTPLRLKFKNRLKADLPFHVLARSMLRRVSALLGVYGNGEPQLDYKGIVARAQDVQIVDSNLRWFDWRRYSQRQDKAMLMGGMIGTVTYEGNLREYLPLVEFCSKVHIGKQTAFGLGQIKAEATK